MALSASLRCHMHGVAVVGCGGLSSPPVMGKRKGSGKWWLAPLECHIPTQLSGPLERDCSLQPVVCLRLGGGIF